MLQCTSYIGLIIYSSITQMTDLKILNVKADEHGVRMIILVKYFIYI
jgi:hypothetical protein